MENRLQFPRALAGIATLTTLIYGGLIGARWGLWGVLLGALIGGALTIVFVWIVGVLLIAVFSSSREFATRPGEFELSMMGTALWIVILIDIWGIYSKLRH